MVFGAKIPDPVLHDLLTAFVDHHATAIARGDLKAPAPLDPACVRVLEWLWRTDRPRAVKVHTALLRRIRAKFEMAEAARKVAPDYLVPRLEAGLRTLGLKAPEMPKSLAQAAAQSARRP